MVKISLCMIVANEEKNLKRCLKSVKGLVDEIIAVVCEGTDNNKAVLEEFDAKVYDYEWKSDFSKARNYSVSKATGDYILFLDADEKLELHRPAAFKKYLAKSNYGIIPVQIVNFYGSRADIRHSHFSGGLRLVQSDNAVSFINKIHERLVTDGKTVDPTGTAGRHLRILHYGYMKRALKRKGERNLSMILNDLCEDKKDGWTDYYLAAEYYNQGKINEAYLQINKSILLFINNGVKPPALCYKLKYDLLVTNHMTPDAYNGIVKVITLYPSYVDLHFYKGILQFNNCEYEAAEKTFSYCLVLGESNLDYLILSGSGSYFAFYYLGLCYQKLGKPSEAAEAFRESDMLYPNLKDSPECARYLPQA